MMAGNPNGPTPLAIRGCRDRVRATQDIVHWVQTTRSGEDDDARRRNEIIALQQKWESLGGGDAVLFVERNEAMELHMTVLPAQQ